MEKTTENTQKVFRPALAMSIAALLMAILFLLILYLGIIALLEADGIELMIMGMLLIITGLGMISYCVCSAWQPLIIISPQGVTIPRLWIKTFVAWENVFETMAGGRGVISFVLIVSKNPKDINWTGGSTKGAAKRQERMARMSGILMVRTLSTAKSQKIIDELQTYQKQYALNNETNNE